MTEEDTVKPGEQISELKHGPCSRGRWSQRPKKLNNAYFRSKLCRTAGEIGNISAHSPS
jgi:hypothetical protein